MLSPDYQGRIERARSLMAEQDIDALLLSVGSDLPYLTGYEAMPLERLTMLVVTSTATTVVVPRLEAPRVHAPDGLFEVRPWDETEDPVAIVAGIVGRPRRALIGDTTWSRFLLGLQEALDLTRFGPASSLMTQLRMHKDAAEIAALRAAAAAADRVMERLDGHRMAGRTERDVSRSIGGMLLEEGHHEVSFAIVASGPNAASPHHEPTDRVIGDGDTVVVDFGGRLDGYCSDTTRTYAVGELDARANDAFAVLREAQGVGVAAAVAGVEAQSVDRVTRRIIADAGWGAYFVHRTGHGIGLDTHEDPYLVEGNALVLEPGMAFSVEPGIYVPGEFGMRIEDIVVIGEDGRPEALNRTDRGLHRVT